LKREASTIGALMTLHYGLLGLAIATLIGAGCGHDPDSVNGVMSLRAFPIADCDQDGAEDYAIVTLYNWYSEPHLADRLRILSGKTGARIAEADLGMSARHTASTIWAASGTDCLALEDRQWTTPKPAVPFVRMSRSGASDFLRELPSSDSTGAVIGLGMRPATDGKGGVFVILCRTSPQFSGSAVCTLYRWSSGEGSELRRFTFKSSSPMQGLECAVGQFEGDSTLDLAISDSGSTDDQYSGAVYLIDGQTAEQRLLVTGARPNSYMGLRVESLHASSASESDLLVIGSGEGANPSGGDSLLAFRPASSNDTTWILQGDSEYSDLHSRMQVMPDMDADGIEDLGYIDYRDESADIVSGRTGALIRRISHGLWQKVESLAACRDVDGDGSPDLLLSVRPGRDQESAPDPADRHLIGCIVVSGADGTTLRRYPVLH